MTYTEQQLTAAIVSQGLRPALALPESGAPPSLLSLIQRCWDSDPQQRPSFKDITEELKIIEKHIAVNSCSLASPANKSQNGNTEVHHYQEALSWLNQGELFAKGNKLDSTVDHRSDIFDQSSKYCPTLSWGSFATCGRRETMEDTHFMLPHMSEEKDLHAFGIFDGHRGLQLNNWQCSLLPFALPYLTPQFLQVQQLLSSQFEQSLVFSNSLIPIQGMEWMQTIWWHFSCLKSQSDFCFLVAQLMPLQKHL